jgi:molybdopterin molybdotransferase
MISVAEALSFVIAGVKPVTVEQVSLPDSLGRVLAEDVASRLTLPPADVSAMDGYAVRAADVAEVPVVLKRIGESSAGSGFSGTVGAGETARIFTGAPLPPGADAIVIQENTEVDGLSINIGESVSVGHFVRPAGMDFKEGEILLRAPKVLTARDIGLAASMNVPWLKVRRRPRIAILATGNELVMPGEAPAADQIVNSNGIALAAYVKALGGDPVDLGIAEDDEDSLVRMLAGARGCDLLVTIGGASVGDYDLVNKVLGDEGMELNFYKVASRPGKPLIFGRLGDTPVLGMPGNPVSVGVAAVIYLRPAMQVMAGLDPQREPTESALLGHDLEANGQRQEYMRATLTRNADGNLVAIPNAAQDSALMAQFAAADCLVVRPPEAPAAAAGERVAIIPLRLGTISL